ncbi:MAG TPA: nitroreductase family protein [Myxococcota bacterium]|nr:nitroreductase family protein [Myxococcota bacterium]
MDALEALTTTRAMRRLKPDPVPEELLKRVIHAATCASSPGNSQGWDFVVVRDPAQRKRIGDVVRAQVLPRLVPIPDSGGVPVARLRMMRGAQYLASHFDAAPVVIFVCGASIYPPGNPYDEFVPAALYPAAQNLIVAARAMGLGTVFTTFHMMCEPQLREIIGLPASHRIQVTIPLGWPEGRFGPVARKPVEEVIHWDRF